MMRSPITRRTAWLARIGAVALALLVHSPSTWAGFDPGAPQCSNGIDDDADGAEDMASPYCKIPEDNDEGSFRSGIPGDDGNLPRVDCWFDTNSGSGDDGCQRHVCCQLDGPCPAEFGGASFNRVQECSTPASAQCTDNCLPRVRVDCDCFGCCTLDDPATGARRSVFLHPAVSPSCTLGALSDPALCRTCTPDATCRVAGERVFSNGFEPLP